MSLPSLSSVEKCEEDSEAVEEREVVEDTGKCEAVMEERCGQVYRQYSMTQLCADVPRTVCHLQQRVTLQSQPRLPKLENFNH